MKAELINAVLRVTPQLVSGALADPPFTRSTRLTFYEWTAVSRFGAGPLKFDFILSLPEAVLRSIDPVDTDTARVAGLTRTFEGVVRRSAKAIGHAATPVMPLRIIKGPDVALRGLGANRRICLPWKTELGPFLIEVGLG